MYIKKEGSSAEVSLTNGSGKRLKKGVCLPLSCVITGAQPNKQQQSCIAFATDPSAMDTQQHSITTI